MDTMQLLFSVICILAFVVGTLLPSIAERIKRDKKMTSEVNPQSRIQKMNYREAMSILDEVILECIDDRVFTLKFNDKKTIPPLDDELVFMTNRVLDSVSIELLNDLKTYVTFEFIVRYVSKANRKYCEEYIRDIRLPETEKILTK